MGTALDDILGEWDRRERHERALPLVPEAAVAAFLGTRAAPDRVVRLLFRVRGLRTEATIVDLFSRMGFGELYRSPTEVVVGASGRPWRLRGGIRPFDAGDPGTVQIATDVRAVPAPGGCVLSTETRIAPIDDAAKRAFRRYWCIVGRFSALIRLRWLAAVERTAAKL
jgi:hypothetical protein